MRSPRGDAGENGVPAPPLQPAGRAAGAQARGEGTLGEHFVLGSRF